jgi:hypothetical protein
MDRCRSLGSGSQQMGAGRVHGHVIEFNLVGKCGIKGEG